MSFLIQRKQQLKLIKDQESGVALIYVAIILPVLIAFAALAIDASNMFAQQARMQNAADAAALAGVYDLALAKSTTQINTNVTNLGTTNGAEQISWSYINSNKGIQVNAQHTFDTFFAGIIGYHTLTVHAHAKAQALPISSAGNLMPMTAKCDDFQLDQVYTMWGNDIHASGSFGWLDWNGSPVSSNELADSIANVKNSPTWSIGDWIPAGPGVQNSNAVNNSLNLWLNKSVIIPLYDTLQGTGSNARYKVCAFGEFVLLDYNFSGGNKWVKGKFVRAVMHGTSSGSTVKDFGVYDIRIVQ